MVDPNVFLGVTPLREIVKGKLVMRFVSRLEESVRQVLERTVPRFVAPPAGATVMPK